MPEPYIEKIANVSGFDIWIVNGKHIRDNIDVEFTNFGQHFRFKFIPRKEFWIDKERTPGEENFYIDHMLIEHRMMEQGASYIDALAKANLSEKRYRKKMDFIKGIHSKEMTKEELITKIHKKLLKEYDHVVKAWIVDGRLIRGSLYIDFTEGGHDYVYEFVPKGEVWIDDDLGENEIKFVLLHELRERALMAQGMSYDKAHMDASSIEYFCRQNPDQLEKKLDEVLVQNKPVEGKDG